MKVEEAIESYIKLRDHKSAIEKATNDKVNDINAVLRKLEAMVMKMAIDSGVNSFKTEHGTAFLQENVTVSVKDWDSTLRHVTSTGQYELLNKAVNKTAVREYYESNQEPPPGVGYGKRTTVMFRRGSN